MTTHKEDVLRLANLIDDINEKMQLRDAFEIDSPPYDQVRQMAGEIVGSRELAADTSTPEGELGELKRRLLALANNIHRTNYFEVKAKLQEITAAIEETENNVHGEGESPHH